MKVFLRTNYSSSDFGFFLKIGLMSIITLCKFKIFSRGKELCESILILA